MTNTRTPLCHVVGAGEFHPDLIQEILPEDLVIAADGGLRHLQEAGITPSLFVGDGDSLGYLPEGMKTKILPCQKDDTDTVSSLREGLRLGYRRFCLYGVLGGKRFSHSLANLQALSFLADLGAEGEIRDEFCTIRLLTSGEHTLDCEGGYFSLLAWEGEACLSVTGAKYPLHNALLTPRFPLGISNEGEKETRITVHRGRVLWIREQILL